MITKADWQAVHQQFRSEPPTAEEMLAYSRGDLSGEEEARIRERLVGHPDLVRTITEPFPTEGAEPGDPDYLSDDDFATHWASLKSRMHREKPAEGGRVLQFWRFAAAVAASVAVLLGVLLWQSSLRVSEPRTVGAVHVLYPDLRRGPASDAPAVTADGDSVLLSLMVSDARDFGKCRIEIIDAATNRTIWSGPAVRNEDDGSVTILVPRRFLRSGTYRIALYGTIGSTEELLATYTFRSAAVLGG